MAEVIAVRHVAFEDLGILETLFAQRGDDVRYVDAPLADLGQPDLQNADLLVVLGAPIGAFDDELYPFLIQEVALIQHYIQAGKPVLGVCLGAQLMARILGAQVKPMGIKEIGFAPLKLTPAGEQSPLRHLRDIPVLHWHGDRFDLPEAATRLADTEICSEQAFSWGDKLLGLQFHLEADVDKIESWLVGHACELAHAGVDLQQIRTDAQRYGQILHAAGLKVIGEWLDQVWTSPEAV